MKLFFFILVVLTFPSLAFASGMTKQQACAYPEGIHHEEVYVLWPGKLPYIEEFLKKDGFLYYFIHTFPDRDTLSAYRDLGGRDGSFLKNSGAYFVSYNCAKSKVKFHTNVRSLGGSAYGRLNWISGQYLSYSLVGRDRDPCITGPDTLFNISVFKKLSLDRLPGLPRTTRNVCIARSAYKNIEDGILQFDIESHTWATKESFYSRYQYYLATNKLKKIR